jgi:hypothetical protein
MSRRFRQHLEFRKTPLTRDTFRDTRRCTGRWRNRDAAPRFKIALGHAFGSREPVASRVGDAGGGFARLRGPRLPPVFEPGRRRV